MKLTSINPHDLSSLGEVEESTEAEVKKKVQQARKAQLVWGGMNLSERIQLLRKITVELIRRKEDLATMATREMGMPISQSRGDVDDSVRYFRWYLDNAGTYLNPETVFEDEKTKHVVYREPLGVAAVITPWNFPLSNFIWGAGQHLVVGNTVVYKTSEEVPFFGKMLETIITGCGLPDGVFSEVYGGGEVGDTLIHQDVDVISFTGSTPVGAYISKVAGEKLIRAVLEMGGSAPGIVFQDADIDAVLETIYSDRFFNCGQVCDALKRLIVHKSRFDEVVEKLTHYLSIKKVGNPEAEDTDIGPLVARRQVELLEDQVSEAVDKGAKVIIGGKRPKGLKGAYFQPTILTGVKRNMRVWQEEVFGPVLPVVSFTTEDEAIELANDTKYGLGSYIFTEDLKKAEEVAGKIKAGMVGINNASYLQPDSPFGGYKRSGIGREHGKFGFYELTQTKVVAIPK
jgi:acyl-CoA reductase-like NAD-dependent aldehyde dehydrogenase